MQPVISVGRARVIREIGFGKKRLPIRWIDEQQAAMIAAVIGKLTLGIPECGALSKKQNGCQGSHSENVTGWATLLRIKESGTQSSAAILRAK